MILIDTDVCIDLLKGNKKILRRREAYDGPIGICFMTIVDARITVNGNPAIVCRFLPRCCFEMPLCFLHPPMCGVLKRP